MDDVDDVVEFFYFVYDVGGVDDGFVVCVVVLDEVDDGVGGYDIEVEGGFVENYYGGIVD